MGGVRLRNGVRRAAVGSAALLAALALIGASASTALAGSHFQGDDSVDSGEIRYEDYTKYDGALSRAISAWNAVGRIRILYDDVWHATDLEVDDVYAPNVTWWAIWEGNIVINDDIHMNAGRLDPVPDAHRTDMIRHVMVHEWGHALGLGNHDDPKWHFTALMFRESCYSCDYIQAPLAHDKVDYNALW